MDMLIDTALCWAIQELHSVSLQNIFKETQEAPRNKVKLQPGQQLMHWWGDLEGARARILFKLQWAPDFLFLFQPLNSVRDH